MALTAKESGSGEFQPIPEGVYTAVCFAVYDLGTTEDATWHKNIHKVLLMWELPDERIEIEGKSLPKAISNRYTLSLSEKANLRKHLEAWRGRAFTQAELEGFDMRNILGKSCQIQVIHTTKNDKTYANIAAIMALPKGMKPLQPENPLKWFSFEENAGFPEDTPEWVQKLIEQSDEFKAAYMSQCNTPPEEVTDLEPF